MLLAAAWLFAAVFVALELDQNAGSGLSILYLLPVVLVGVELGRRAGIAAGLVAFGLYVEWAPYAAVALAPSAYVTRALVSVLIGAVAGHLADRMRAAAAEAEASARHFELAGDLLATATFDGCFIHLNGAWERCLGWTREELTARPFLDFVHPDDRARTEAEAARALSRRRQRALHATATARRTAAGAWIEWHSWIDSERQADPRRRARRDRAVRRRGRPARGGGALPPRVRRLRHRDGGRRRRGRAARRAARREREPRADLRLPARAARRHARAERDGRPRARAGARARDGGAAARRRRRAPRRVPRRAARRRTHLARHDRVARARRRTATRSTGSCRCST